jgi:hypothetical protein
VSNDCIGVPSCCNPNFVVRTGYVYGMLDGGAGEIAIGTGITTIRASWSDVTDVTGCMSE